MRLLKIITFILLIQFLNACDKDEVANQEKAVNLTISNSDTLQYSLGFFGDEEGASIQHQASRYQISEIDRDMSGEIFYLYKTDSTFIGTDYVELKSARGSDGASPNNDIVITKLTIIVE